MSQGWIKLHRSILDWEWYDDINTMRLFLHCLFKANHKDKKYRGTLVKRGTFLTGLDLLSKQTGLSVSQLRTAQSKLKSTSELAIKTSSKGTVIEVVNYDKYQSMTSGLTDERQTNDKPIATNKNDKNDKNEKNDKNTPLVEEVWSMTPRMGKSRSSKAKLKTALSKTKATRDEIMDGLRAWVDSADWKKDGGQYVQGIHIWAKDCKWENPPPQINAYEQNKSVNL